MHMTAEQFFDAALAKVESPRIREWANSANNRPIFIQIAEGSLRKKGLDVAYSASHPPIFSKTSGEAPPEGSYEVNEDRVLNLSAYITATAVGLI